MMDGVFSTEGFMAVFAVTGSVALLSMQAHRRLLSDFISKLDSQIIHINGGVTNEPKKKVRFAGEIPYVRDHPAAAAAAGKIEESLEGMPENWQVLYKGILKHRNRRL
ncbi:uncharacterized protein LOC127251941 [Andrographis paniculata]|uniref:uncharacterized protein LOC127251941 n=1 Tax=Andrographis paniculata TaxID=175694 RepID=UPI0021E6DF64|nr:uncharacterized protein LOC127251941 [Andrographis paniculata]